MSIRTLAARLRRDDAGIGLVEVLVAMMVFAFIAAGVAVALVTMTKFTYDSKNRETATNLAAAKIDELLAVTDVNSLNSVPVATTTVNGITYTVTTAINWAGSDNQITDCSASAVNLLDRSANVTVTWPGMIATNPVVADTLLAPNARVTDPTLGTIIATVVTQTGQPVSGVAISVSGTGGTANITAPATGVQGCTVVVRVPPGSYIVGATKGGYIDTTQTFTPATTVAVAAGGTAKAQFQMELAANISLNLAANSTANPLKPSSLSATWISKTTSVAAAVSPTARYPFAAGYSVVAGDATTCAANDPANWPADATHNAGVRGALVASTPGGAATANVPMAIVTVTAPDNGTLQAVQQGTIAGGPSCATPVTYTFGTATKNQSYTIALPYGSYKLYVAKSGGGLSNISNIAIVGGVVQVADALTGGLVTTLLGGGTVVSGSTAILDPRSAK